MKTNTPQYTLRNLPEPVDRYIRKRAKISGHSLNQTIINELSERAGLSPDSIGQSAVQSLGWFIGSGIDSGTLAALADEDKAQKELMARELGL